MRYWGVLTYVPSIFLLYIATDLKVALTLTSVSLSVLYVWTKILWLIQRKEKGKLKVSNGFLVANLLVILAGALIVSVTLAVLLLVIFLALYGFILLVLYGLRKEPPAENAELRLKWFGVLLLGFFSLNPFIEGVSASNWVEAVAVIMIVCAGYVMFEGLRKDSLGRIEPSQKKFPRS
ncbi:hypothetical protein [Thermococcus sp. Bubb.Bath]|uniref:hypothetical protein n=1 Tax=Thermococcus sp. Bubb.Bath TaxID=1638242 RepID=UPI00143AB653|nr:hypothetical protein [Thermococcus sp. Bubb.Bath]NJF25579.1 hypothetical protein [Thermococcus sp. Bubb.Bath]